MKSVGEVMSIGRSYAEALQKATQSLENNAVGLGNYTKKQMSAEELIEYIKVPKWDRVFRIKDALMLGVSIGTISKITGIDRWFVNEIQRTWKNFKMKRYPTCGIAERSKADGL
jgi:carbamoyl-phosphate synthase large subunit